MPEINTYLTSRTFKLIRNTYKNDDAAMTEMIMSDLKNAKNCSLHG